MEQALGAQNGGQVAGEGTEGLMHSSGLVHKMMETQYCIVLWMELHQYCSFSAMTVHARYSILQVSFFSSTFR